MLYIYPFPPSPGVYIIRCVPTGETYVGSSKNLKRRMQGHLNALTRKGSCPPKLRAAWDQHGPGAFRFELVTLCDLSDRYVQEQAAIDLHSPQLNLYTALSPRGGNTAPRPHNHGSAISIGRYRHTVRGVLGSVVSLARHFGVVSPALASSRVADGWDVGRAVSTPTLPPPENQTGLQGVVVMRGRDGKPNGKYGARAKVSGKPIWLGTFSSAEAAHEAWRKR